jgi:hypothetical protein
MTIEEKDSWTRVCPHIHGVAGCYGKLCMMWRWANVKNEAYIPRSPMLSLNPVHPADEISPWRPSTTHGYCGLAGRT